MVTQPVATGIAFGVADEFTSRQLAWAALAPMA